MPLKPSLLPVMLVFSLTAFSQKKWEYNGDDSLTITARYDSSTKKYFVKWQSVRTVVDDGNDSTKNKFSLSSSLIAKIKPDSLKQKISDSLKNNLNRDSLIEVTIHGKNPDKPAENNDQSGLNSSGSEPNNNPPLPTPDPLYQYLFFGLLGALVLSAVIISVLKYRKKSLQKIQDVGGKPIKTILPRSLIDHFPDARKHDLDGAVTAILHAFHKKDGQLKDLGLDLKIAQTDLENVNRKINGLQTTVKEKEDKIAELNGAIDKKNEELLTLDQRNLEFKRLAQILINKYFVEFNSNLREKEGVDDKEIDQFILKNIIALAFHSASLLRLQIQMASNNDELNTKLLDGKEINPTNTITETSTFNSSASLAYHVFQLLKSHGIKGLDDVLVDGNKMGA